MISIIIVSYNTQELLEKCLRSVYHCLQTFKFEVIVIDNASSDNSVAIARRTYKKATVISNHENVGFSRGCNIAAKKAKGEILFFLNSDTEVVNLDLSYVEELMKNEKIGAIGGMLENQEANVERARGKSYDLVNVFVLLFGEHFTGQYTKLSHKTQKVDWVSGGCMFVKKSIFEKVNGFDEHIFMYLEDVELCYRIKKLGYDILYHPEIRVKHVGQGSSNRSFAITQIYKGLQYFYKKHKSPIECILLRLLLFTKAALAIIIGTLTNNRKLTQTYKTAIQA